MRTMIAVLWLLAMASVMAGDDNLVANGDFERGRGQQPADWSELDGLTAGWGSEGNPDRCLELNTAVTQAAKQANEKGLPTDGPTEAEQGKSGQYGAVGAHEGAWAFAAPIEIEADARYFIVEADVRGPRSTRIFYPQVLLRGFQRVAEDEGGEHSSYFHVPHEGGPAFSEMFGKEKRPTRAGDYLQVWRSGLVCRIPQPGEWHHFQLAFKLPSVARYRPEVLLVKPYAMWPLGTYAFDNVVVRACSQEEYTRVRKQGHSAQGF